MTPLPLLNVAQLSARITLRLTPRGVTTLDDLCMPRRASPAEGLRPPCASRSCAVFGVFCTTSSAWLADAGVLHLWINRRAFRHVCVAAFPCSLPCGVTCPGEKSVRITGALVFVECRIRFALSVASILVGPVRNARSSGIDISRRLNRCIPSASSACTRLDHCARVSPAIAFPRSATATILGTFACSERVAFVYCEGAPLKHKRRKSCAPSRWDTFQLVNMR